MSFYEGHEAPFPVLERILHDYFPAAGQGRDTDRSAEMIRKYHRVGEDSAEFDGLSADLKRAINRRRDAAVLVNATLDTDLTPEEVTAHLISLLDQLTDRGEFAGGKPTAAPAEVLRSYALARFRVPWIRRDAAPVTVPLWATFLAGLVLIIFGAFALPHTPSAIRPLTIGAAALGLVLMFVSALAMLGLRSEALDPDKSARQEAERSQRKRGRAKRSAAEAQGPGRVQSLFRRLR